MGKYILVFIISISPILVNGQSSCIDHFKIDHINWWKLDQGLDSLASISWNKGVEYLRLKNNHPKKQIKIAVIDTDFDLDHKLLNDLVIIKQNEFLNYHFDDDNNGYIDDYSGWNFLGIKKRDSALAYVQMESTRLLNQYNSTTFKKLKRKNKLPFKYVDVKSSFDSTVISLEKKINAYKEIEPNYTYVMDTLQKLILDKISLKTLKEFHSPNDTIMGYVNFARYYYEKDFPYDEFIDHLNLYKLSLDICMNLDYDNHELIEENTTSLQNTKYGNNIFGKNITYLTHGTTVTGVIAHSLVDSTSINKKQSSLIKPGVIMPITFTGIGDFTDKDFYSAFKYAINNDVNIINLSQSKEFTIHPKILKKALNLAKKNNVLVVMSAGNQASNLDDMWRFPQSIPKLYNKDFDNLIIVGATTKTLNENLIDQDSNYGLKSVDIFAPGEDIQTILPNNKFGTKSGTSFATPIVTNLALLLWSHYPELKASEIRKIILESGFKYDGMVNVPCDSEENPNCKNTPQKKFSNLSKSGKLVNTLNAIKLANSKISN